MKNMSLPASCLLCCQKSGEAAFCEACYRGLPWLPAMHCPRCALPTMDGGLCGQCLKSIPSFSRTEAAFLYTGEIQQLIHAAKYGKRWSIFSALSELLLPKLMSLSDLDWIIPLPLHRARLKERGFNQAIEIARPLSKKLGIPLKINKLRRIKDTEHQARLTTIVRAKNVQHAFEADDSVYGKNVALVDDVLTSGASLNSASLALLGAGAQRVDCWILARTPIKDFLS